MGSEHIILYLDRTVLFFIKICLDLENKNNDVHGTYSKERVDDLIVTTRNLILLNQ